MKRRVSTHSIITCVLWAGLAVSMAMMQLAFNRHDRDATDLFGICSGVLCCAAALSSFLLASRFVAQKNLEDPRNRVHSRRAEFTDYVAQHSTKDKIVISVLLSGLGMILVFFAFHPRVLPIWMWFALSVLFCVNSVTAYRTCTTTIRFESDRISLQIAPFINFSESYSDIPEIRAKRGVLELHFADGRTMSRWSNLGDSDMITEILMQKTDVLPH